MTNQVTQHEHKEFIDKIMHKVKTRARLVGLLTSRLEPWHNEWRSDLRDEANTLLEDIENSLYRRLDEVGDSE